jgi:CubicO group peptidase (beta-lactamase class C family)
MASLVRSAQGILCLTAFTVCAAVPARADVPKRGSVLDRTALSRLVKRAGELDTDALVVMKDGQIVLERWFGGGPRRVESMSITKSIVSMAFGRLLMLGKLKTLDEPVHTFYPEWRQGRKRKITIRHLLTQTSGIQGDPKTGTEIYGNPDFVQLALCAELTDEPGSRFFYNNKATNLLAGIVQRIDGRRLDEFMKEEIFAPLGISDVMWERDPAGNPHAMSGLQIRPADLAKLGQLMLAGGTWRGKPLLGKEWVTEATTPHEGNGFYGQLWWLIKEVAMTIDDEVIAAWRKGGDDEKFIAAVTPLKGRILRDDFFEVIGKVLADQGGVETWHNNTWRKDLPDGKVVESKVVGFRGDGWQGQALVVLPAQGIVVVRMREPKEGNTDQENQKYGFPELVKMSRALVPTAR